MLADLQLQEPSRSRFHVIEPTVAPCSGAPARFPKVATIDDGAVVDKDTCGTPEPTVDQVSAIEGAALPPVACRLEAVA